MLPKIYRIFAEETKSIAFACGPGCATCCTRSVTLTTGEGRLILDFLHRNARELPRLPIDNTPLRPPLTTNGLAALYLAGREPEGEVDSPWLFEPCFFLHAGLCTIYAARPFACRSFGSTVNCGKTGMAEAPEWFVTLTIVVNQLLESLDQPGYWGNLSDVLARLTAPEDPNNPAANGRLLANQPAPELLVMPAERHLAKRFLRKVETATGLDLKNLRII